MKKILIIDDSPMQLKLAGMYLAKEDFVVLNAESGKEGIEKAEQEKPDLIILDIEMPEMDGLETLKMLKSYPTTSHIDVLMCSSVKKEEVINEAIKLGAKGYLNKPHGFRNFNAHVKGILSQVQ
jgi:DNA-binding response OmpR family regulator